MVSIAIMGHGVVGSGVAEIFTTHKQKLYASIGEEVYVKKILDLREFPDSPLADRFTKNFEDIINDLEIRVVVEVMGGLNPAYDFVKRCLKAGKSVVTSNKELVAAHGAELLEIAKETNTNFLFEASVGGGIPIIRPMSQCLVANNVDEIAGILNGTTNFILTKMITEKMSFENALAMAQRLGYAEKNPAADVEGADACRKICILSSLAFGKHVYPDWVHCEGITELTLEDVAYAQSWGGAVKLIGSVKKLDDGRILPMVAPRFVCDDCLLSSIDDVFNGIMVCGDGFDKVMFYGRGAGKLPTASAVLGDVIDCAKHNTTILSQMWEDSTDNSFIEDYKEAEVRMYVRVKGADKAAVAALFGDVEYLSREGQPDDELAFITAQDKEKNITEKLEKLNVLGKIRLLDM